MHPDKKIIIPLAPEQIKNEDGTEKQDCEMNAGKRMIEKIKKAHPKMKIIITADGLYPKTPFLQVLEENKMSYIIRAKEGGNPEVFSWAEELKRLGTIKKMSVNKEKGIVWEYEWVNGIPLTGKENSKIVNYAGFRIINPNAQKNPVTFTGHWITDIEITKDNVEQIVSGGRARWKIENECFNTLKNHGYELEHNYGHGEKNLSYIFFILNLLAFTIHEILEIADEKYLKLKEKAGRRITFIGEIRFLFNILCMERFDSIFEILIGLSEKTIEMKAVPV